MTNLPSKFEKWCFVQQRIFFACPLKNQFVKLSGVFSLFPYSSEPEKKKNKIPYSFFISGFKSEIQFLENRALKLVEKLTCKTRLLRCFGFLSITPTAWAFGH